MDLYLRCTYVEQYVANGFIHLHVILGLINKLSYHYQYIETYVKLVHSSNFIHCKTPVKQVHAVFSVKKCIDITVYDIYKKKYFIIPYMYAFTGDSRMFGFI